MRLDCRELPADHVLEAQVCIIGSGPVGCAIARELVSRGLQVIVVEAGAETYRPRQQAAYWAEDDRHPHRHPPLRLWRRRMLGGTSSVWGGRCLPFSREDFDDWGAPWPISYDEFAAYLPRAARFLEIGTSDFDGNTALAADDRTFLGGYRHPNLNTEVLDRHSPPTNVASRYWSEAIAGANPTVLLNAPCAEIRLDRTGQRAERAIVAPSADKRCSVRASSFVLAAGGLETARLMLASNRDRDCGLGNEYDLVGRFYMTHFVGNLARLSTGNRASRRDLSFVRTIDGIYAKRTLQPSATAKRREGLGAFVLRPSIGRISDPAHGSGVLSALFLARFLLKNELYANMGRRSTEERRSAFALYSCHAANILRDAPSLVAFAYKWYVDRPRRYRKLPGYDFRRRDGTYPLEFNAEQISNYSSRVYLGDNRDPLGMPLIAVDWRVCDDDRRTVRRGFELIRDALAGSNVAHVVYDEAELEAAVAELWPAGGHHIGTTRWSSSPRQGVVGPDMQVWSVNGLYVAGSAIFPRSGTANPTLSAVAMALRLADDLASRIGDGPHVAGIRCARPAS